MIALLWMLGCPKDAPQPAFVAVQLDPEDADDAPVDAPTAPAAQDGAHDPVAAELIALAQDGLSGSTRFVLDQPAIELLEAGGWASTGAPGALVIPDDCGPVSWYTGDGYGAIAVPPPMTDDGPEQVAAVESTIALLRDTVEVGADCTVQVHEEECWEATPDVEAGCETIDDVYERPLFAIAMHQADGGWKVVGWRDFTQETGLDH